MLARVWYIFCLLLFFQLIKTNFLLVDKKNFGQIQEDGARSENLPHPSSDILANICFRFKIVKKKIIKQIKTNIKYSNFVLTKSVDDMPRTFITQVP